MSGVETSGGNLPSPDAVRQIMLKHGARAMGDALRVVQADWVQRANRAGARRTGTYLRSITTRVTRDPRGVLGSIGSSVRHALYLERGTGLYGPAHRWIVPTHARVLRWPAGGGHATGASGGRTFQAGPGFTLAGRRRAGRAGGNAQYAFARRVRGIMPRRFGHDAFTSQAGAVERIFIAAAEAAADEIARRAA